jgi:hypothetical protein
MSDRSKCGCGKSFKSEQGLSDHQRDMNHNADTKPFKNKPRHTFDPENKPDWTSQCEVCGATPVVPATGMCGPCTFGEADTVAGNW